MVRVAIEEVDDDLLADARQGDLPPAALSGPTTVATCGPGMSGRGRGAARHSMRSGTSWAVYW
ncbi:hypothetical protein A9979_13460 [Pseudomonas sp. UMC76]|nr:hypothetical protein [Pseudomonas sp. UMC76]